VALFLVSVGCSDPSSDGAQPTGTLADPPTSPSVIQGTGIGCFEEDFVDLPEADAPIPAEEAERIARAFAIEFGTRHPQHPVPVMLLEARYVRTQEGGGVSSVNGTVTIDEPRDREVWIMIFDGNMSTPVPMAPDMTFEIAYKVYVEPDLPPDYCAGTTVS
jgi:hypothetical protein